MKTKNSILQSVLVLFLAFTVVSCSDDNDGPGIDEVQISEESLPQSSRTIINTYFSGDKIKVATQASTPNIYNSIYTVHLESDFEIDFDKDGHWTEIEGEDDQAIPMAFIQGELPGVYEYLIANFEGHHVVELERERFGFTVELDNDIELVFDHKQIFIGMDLGDDDDDEERIPVEQLPEASRNFLIGAFKDINIITAEKDRDDNELTYQVYLSNGIKIEFAADGRWTEIESEGRIGVPFSVLPSNVASYIGEHFKNYSVSEVEIEDNGSFSIEIRLNTSSDDDDDIELNFDKNGNFINIW